MGGEVGESGRWGNSSETAMAGEGFELRISRTRD